MTIIEALAMQCMVIAKPSQVQRSTIIPAWGAKGGKGMGGQ